MSSSAESNQQESSREQAFVVGPAFSLADSHEGGHKLQNVNVPQTVCNDSHQFAPAISNMQTLSPDDFNANSISVSGPSIISAQEPQISIGSVFSLADSHIEHHTSQHETEDEVRHISTDSSARPKDDSQLLLGSGTSIPTSAAHQQSVSAVTSMQDVQLPVSQKNSITESENKTTDVLRGEETHEKPASLTKLQDSSATSQMLPNTSKVQEPEIVDLDIEDIDDCMLVKIDINRPRCPYGSKIHNSEFVIEDSDNDEDVTVLTTETSVSSGETSSGKCDEQRNSVTSTVVIDENYPTGSLSMEVEEINTEASKTNSEQTTATCTMSSTGQSHVTSVMSTGTKTRPLSDQVFLEESCSTWCSPEIENPESELMDLHVDDDECDDTPLSTAECESLKVLTSSRPDNNLSTPVLQSLDLHVDDDDEYDYAPLSTVEYESLKVLTPSQPDKNVSTPVIQSMDLHVDDDNECDDAPLSTVEYESLKVLTPSQLDKNVSTPVIQSMDLHVDDNECYDAPLSTVEYESLKVLTPSQPDKNVSTPVTLSMDLHVDDNECDDAPLSTVEYESLKVLTPSQPDKNVSTPVTLSMSSSLLSSTSDIPVFKESFRIPSLEPAVQGQVIENTLRHSEVPLFSSHEDVRKGQVSQVIDSSKVAPTVPRHESHHLQLDGATGTVTNSKCSHKPSPKGKAMKSTTPTGKAIKSTTPRPKGKSTKSLILKIKIPSAARTQKKSPSYSDINSKTIESTLTSTETDSSVVCKLCFKVFSSRMELVTHTWNWHKSSLFVENNLKCDECGKCFANNCLLKLHKKVKCTRSNTTDVDPGTMQVSLDSLWHTLIKQNRVNEATEVSSSSAAFRRGTEPQPSTSGLSSGSAAVEISSSTHVDVSSVLKSFTQRNSVSNYSSGVMTGAATDTHPDFATGDELMQDIKPVITSSGELLQRSDGPDQVLAGGHPSVSDNHKCTTCQKMFSNSFQLSLHQQVSEGCKVARNDFVRCFVCAKTFTSSIIRYLHVLNNPECKEKVDRYCSKCSHLFNSLADKQDHLRMFKACQIYEECSKKNTIAKNVGHVEQNVKEPGNQLHPVFTACEISQPDKSAALAQENNSTQVTDSSVPNSVSCQVSLPDSDILQQLSQTNPAGKSCIEKPKGREAFKQKPYVKAKPSTTCPECKKKFATSAILILHFNESPKCRIKVCSPSVARKVSTSEVAKKISASDRINVPNPVAIPKSPGSASTVSVIKSSSAAVTASRNVFRDLSCTDRSITCKVCGAEFVSENELTHHTELKCRKLQIRKAVPQLKNLRVVLSRVSVMCHVCHLPFADDIRLAEHIHLNQSCQKGTSETVKRVLELNKSHLDIGTLKRDGERRSCEIVTGISNVTSTISMASTKDGCIALVEQMPAVDNVTNEKLAKGIDGHISSNSSAKKQYVCDQGNANDESKGRADDSDKDELISSMSPSDEGSDMEESGSSSEEGNRDYTCKQCCKTYASKSMLIQHSKSRHQSAHSKRTHCKVCTRKFHDLTGLQAHLLQFKFCFMPLTRPLWERKQEPQICSMCKKVLGSSKDLRKHCFKKMACRLRYINLVLKNTKEKDHVSVQPAAGAKIPVLKIVKEKGNTKVVPASEAVLEVSNTGKENCESQSANEVSSSVQDYCNPVEVDSSNSNVDSEDETNCIKISHVASRPLIKCLNCSGLFDDFQEHLLKQQACLDFFGIHVNKCPVPLPFCYQCKTHFDDISLLQLHSCKGFVAYTHVCQICGLKFTSAHNLHTHVQQSLTCNKTNLSSPQKNNGDRDYTFVDSSAKHHHDGMFASSSAVRDVPTSLDEQFFTCLICDTRFATLRLLMEHSHQHVEETPFSCDRCSITFVHYNQFVSHQAFHIRMDKEANILVERPQHGRLESAILKYRSSPHPTQHQEIDSAASQTEHKETDTHRVLMKHQREQLSSEASPSRDPTSSTGDFPEETCCLNCGQCFWTMTEVKVHQSLSGHRHLLPRSVMERADWQRLMCKFCDLKYILRQTLFNHMVNKHSNNVSVLFRELGYTSAFCSLCHEKIKSSRLQHHFQQHQKKFVQEIRDRSQQSLESHSVELCIFCNGEYSSQKDLLEHMQRHTHADIFTSQLSKASPVLNSRKCSVGSSRKHEEDQRLGSTVESVVSSNKPGSCKLCGKQIKHIRYLSSHFKYIHKEYDPQSWKDWFVPSADLKQESSTTKTLTSSEKLRAAFQKYRCKLCRRTFSHLNRFVNHFSLSHKDINPERQEEFFEKYKATELLYVRATLKSRRKPQLSESGISSKTVKSQPKLFNCNVCNRNFSVLRFFKVHFKQAHRNYNVTNWEDLFNVIGTAHPDSTNTEAATSFRCLQSASETLKLEHASTDSKSKDGDSAVFDSDMLPSVSRKRPYHYL